MNENPATQSGSDRVIRVFISSTFRDMMRERDLLVKDVFPDLRRKCAQRFVTFTEVDLRWGVTEQQANEGQVLPLCLAEIERSRPYFIGLLGQRYGWIPDTIRPEVIESQPWLKEHLEGRTSVTELEILHGVLNNPMMQSHAFFYFRDPAYASDPALTDDERWDMIEHDIRADVEQYGPAEATRRTEERETKLGALKQRIRDSGLPLVEPYADPKALAELVRRQFDALIDHLYPQDQTPDLLVQERMAHEAHAKSKLFACIERPEHLAAINTFAAPAEHDGQGLVITGESGGGKTALLAAWSRDWATNHPDDLLFQHYFGATPDSASPAGFLRRLLGELKNRFGITDDIPADSEKLRDALPLWLAQTVGKGRVVLVLDGLNQVQGSDADRRLLFLPRYFPPHVTVVASSLPGPALDALRERHWTEHDLPPASEPEVEAMVDEYLAIHARAMRGDLWQQLVSAPGAKNPLFLRTVLEELRQFGSFEKLPERVAYFLEAGNPRELFLRVLRRWQEDFDGKDAQQDAPKIDLVRRALTHLWAARQGLSEPEWLDLLGDGSEPLARALWSPLFLALDPHLSQRAGLSAFGHDFLRQAVEAAFVSSEDLQQAAHLSVADYFERQPVNPRTINELPWQLAQAQQNDRLKVYLTNLDLFPMILANNEMDAVEYWKQLQPHFDMPVEFIAAIRSCSCCGTPDEISNKLYATASFLQVASVPHIAEVALRCVLEFDEESLGTNSPNVVRDLSSLALELGRMKCSEEAGIILTRVVETLRSLSPINALDLANALNNLGLHHATRGRSTQAEHYWQEALQNLEASEETETLTHANVLSNASAYDSHHDAVPKLRRALQIVERIYGQDHPVSAEYMTGLAKQLIELRPIEAEKLARHALSIMRAAFGKDDRRCIDPMCVIATLYSRAFRISDAESLIRTALEIENCFESPRQVVIAHLSQNLATVLLMGGKTDEAISLLSSALAFWDIDAAYMGLAKQAREQLALIK